MQNKILLEIDQKCKDFFQKWKYLLLQEKCRLCKRMIHPLIEKMDFNSYGPAAKYLIAGKEINSDVICQLCLPKLASTQSVLKTHQFIHSRNSFEGMSELLIASGAIFMEPIQSLIYSLKYSEDVLLAKDLACVIYQAWRLLKNEMDINNLDSLCLVPVPLHKKRLQQRGFNQAQVLAEHLSYLLSIKLETKLLERVRNTKSQQILPKVERAKNVAQAFKCKHSDAFIDKKVVLVDDVSTSGATLAECAKAVMAGGAQSVYALTVAFVP